MRVSVCIVTHNEEARIRRCVEALAAQTECGFRWEIVVVDNASVDRTLAVLDTLALQIPVPLRRICLGANNLGAARAAATQAASGEAVAFVDADVEVPRGWLRTLVATLEGEQLRDRRVCAVGGGNFPPREEEAFHEALGLMFTSFLGTVGSTQVTLARRSRLVRHLSTCNVIYDRERLMEAGNFDAAFARVCEDVDMSCRLVAQGGRLIFADGLDVVHHHRPSFRSWTEKIFRYGWGQMAALAKHPQWFSRQHALPLAFAAAFIALLFLGLRATVTGLALYGAGVAGFSLCLAWRGSRLALFPQVFALFVITHFSYAAGQVWGTRFLLQARLHREATP